MKKKNYLFIIPLLITAISNNVYAVNANSNLNYSSSNCIPSTSNRSFAPSSQIKFTGNTVYNNSYTKKAVILCNFPLYYGVVYNGFIQATDLNPSDNFICYARKYHHDANGVSHVKGSSWARTVGYGSHRQHISFTGYSGASTNYASAQQMLCVIPKRTRNGASSLIMYNINKY